MKSTDVVRRNSFRGMLVHLFLAGLWVAGVPGSSWAAEASVNDVAVEIETAPVLLDGVRLFELSGVSAYPASKRAQAVSDRIKGLAADASFAVSNLQVLVTEEGVQVMAGNKILVAAIPADATREGVTPDILAKAYVLNLQEAITRYRVSRSPAVVLAGVGRAATATLVLGVVLLILSRIVRRINEGYERRYRTRIEELKIKSFELGKLAGLRRMIRTLGRILGVLVLLGLLGGWLNYVLDQFVWTRPLAEGFDGLLLDPLRAIAGGLVGAVPNLVFLVILILLFRFVLKLTHLFFRGVEQGVVRLSGFDPEWAQPTLQIVRVLIVAFGIVVAYPYVPGSGTAAFKGVSLFVGVMFSLGSSTAIANLIAGYALVYRRAFKVGDRVKIGDSAGVVAQSHLMVTKLRTVKNEELIIPNSQIVNTTVVNYTSLSRDQGLILHTTVGIGYETPWRQVEAMLLIAAERTPGLLREPKPFVRQLSLGDFAVTYEINAYTDQPGEGPRLTSLLHAHILDVFNEYGVQIMTPAYEGDTEQAKVVPKDQWFLAPARPPEEKAPRT